jgi:MoCo/4Fe-4S cofactor protein with predicted Tat translocation signal
LLDVSPLIQIRKHLSHRAERSARTTGVDLARLREKLAAPNGPAFWSSLEELAGTEEFRKFVEDEFPDRTPDWNDSSKRRTFLKLMGASLALAGLGACTKQPPEKIVPYVRQPDEIVPGKPLFYATARPAPGGAVGVLAESHMGRPTKLEGNPSHPSSLGATDRFTQAAILDLWDPDRSEAVTRNGQISSWLNFIAVLGGARADHATRQGDGLRILIAPFSSPSLSAMTTELLSAMPRAKVHQWEPVMRIPGYQPVYNLAAADVVVSLDADFLGSSPGSVRYARDFAAKRRVMQAQTPAEQKRNLQREPEEDRPIGAQAGETYAREAVPGKSVMNRLYVAEGTPSVTGAKADHRIRIRTSEVHAFALELAKALGVGSGAAAANLPDGAARVIPAIARDLQAHRGTSLVIAGDYQPVEVHALAHAMNQALGNTGKTVSYASPIDFNPTDNIQSLRDLVADMNAGRVQTLVIIGCNPVYDAPVDLGFAEALKKVQLRAHISQRFNETSAYCQWHVPLAHFLEAWSDARAHDGTATIIQPLIAPLYGGVTEHQVLSVLLNKPNESPHDIVKSYWRSRTGAANFDAWWQQTLNDGVVPDSAAPLTGNPGLPAASGAPPSIPAGTLEIVFRPDPAVWDGSFSNNGWMQEMPKPQNKMTWDNALWISPGTAHRLGLNTRDVVEVEYKGRKIEAPVWVLPGHADDSVTVHLGYGRTRGGRVADGVGFNAYAIRTSDAPWAGTGVRLRKTGAVYDFATTQQTQTMEERDPVKIMSFAEYLKEPHVEAEQIPAKLTMFPGYEYGGYKWGMTIDLNACTGCQACLVACQAENNIPVVGKDQVSRGRHMNWLRVDRYYRGSFEDPETYYQPIPCMQCENAPCEVVCPVAATVHSGDGLNQMVYNRCVGTRYCSNNCPYKVRRFNFYLYSDWYTESLYGVRNPDVTVRSRGVMEKCTYCVQRINAAKIESEKEDRRILDGEILTACQQVCPTEAIVFGDINDPNSRVAKMKAQPRNYSLLEELSTRPRTTYLATVRNPNSEIEKG